MGSLVWSLCSIKQTLDDELEHPWTFILYNLFRLIVKTYIPIYMQKHKMVTFLQITRKTRKDTNEKLHKYSFILYTNV